MNSKLIQGAQLTLQHSQLTGPTRPAAASLHTPHAPTPQGLRGSISHGRTVRTDDSISTLEFRIIVREMSTLVLHSEVEELRSILIHIYISDAEFVGPKMGNSQKRRTVPLLSHLHKSLQALVYNQVSK